MPPPSESCSGPRVLRFLRSDHPESFILLHVADSGSLSSSLDLIATEGENPFTGTVRKPHLKKLRAKNYHGSDDEWAQIVWHVLGQPAESVGDMESFQHIEASATICGSGIAPKELVISIRKRIEGITQRLGSVTLIQNDEQEIQLFDWCGAAITSTNALEQHCHSLRDCAHAAEITIHQLNEQIQQLIGAKEQHEEQLLANLVRLLNEKKLKIRNQRRLLDTAGPDLKADPKIQASSPHGSQASFKNPRGKRYARGPTDSGSEKADLEETDIGSTADDKASRATDDDTEGSVTNAELSAQHGVEKQYSVGTEGSSAHPALEAAASRSHTDFSATRLIQPGESAEGSDKAAETAGETDDDEL